MHTPIPFRKVLRCVVLGGAAVLLMGGEGCLQDEMLARYLQCILSGECTELVPEFFVVPPEPAPEPQPTRDQGVPEAADTGAEFGAALAAPVTGELTAQTVRLVVGAPGDTTDGSLTGAVYVYTGWTSNTAEPVRLVPSDRTPGARFGASVAVERVGSEAIVIVGAPGTVPSGAAYVFESSGSVWVETARLTPDTMGSYSEFGASVALVDFGPTSDPLVVVGAPSDQDGGHVSVFRRAGESAWAADSQGSHLASLQPAEVMSEDRFGSCLSAVDGFLAVGAPGRGGYMGAGAAYLFHYDAGTQTWSESPTRMEPEGTPQQSAFGTSVAISVSTGANTPTVIVGAPGGGYGETKGTVWTFLRGADGSLARRRFASTLIGFGGAVAADKLHAALVVGIPDGDGDPTYAAHLYSPVDWQAATHTGRPLRGAEPWYSHFDFGAALVVQLNPATDSGIVYVGAPGEGRRGQVYLYRLDHSEVGAKRTPRPPDGNRYLAFRADATHPGTDTVQVLVDLPLRPPFRAEVTVGSFEPTRRDGLVGGSIALRLDERSSDPPSFVLLRASFDEAGLTISSEDDFGVGWQRVTMPSEWVADLAVECSGGSVQLWARPRGVGEFAFVSSTSCGTGDWSASMVIEGIAAGSEAGMDDPRLVANGALAPDAPPVDTAIDKIYAAIDRELAVSGALDAQDLAGALVRADEARARLAEARTAVREIPTTTAKARATGPKAASKQLAKAARDMAKARALIKHKKRTKQILAKLTRSLSFAGRALAALRS